MNKENKSMESRVNTSMGPSWFSSQSTSILFYYNLNEIIPVQISIFLDFVFRFLGFLLRTKAAVETDYWSALGITQRVSVRMSVMHEKLLLSVNVA